MLEGEAGAIIREVGDEVHAGTNTVGKRRGGAIGNGTRCASCTVVVRVLTEGCTPGVNSSRYLPMGCHEHAHPRVTGGLDA